MLRITNLVVVAFAVAISGCGPEVGSTAAGTHSNAKPNAGPTAKTNPSPESDDNTEEDINSDAYVVNINSGVYGLWKPVGSQGYMKIEKDAVSYIVPCKSANGKRFGSAVARSKAEITDSHIWIKENKKHEVRRFKGLAAAQCTAELRVFKGTYKVEGDTLVIYNDKGQTETYSRAK